MLSKLIAVSGILITCSVRCTLDIEWLEKTCFPLWTDMAAATMQNQVGTAEAPMQRSEENAMDAMSSTGAVFSSCMQICGAPTSTASEKDALS